EYFEAAVDPRLRIQHEFDLPPNSGCGDAAGAEKPGAGRSCGVYVVANRLATAPAGRNRRSPASAPTKSSSRTRPPLLASLPKNRGLHHRLLEADFGRGVHERSRAAYCLQLTRRQAPDSTHTK